MTKQQFLETYGRSVYEVELDVAESFYQNVKPRADTPKDWELASVDSLRRARFFVRAILQRGIEPYE